MDAVAWAIQREALKARFQGLRGDIIEENINKAFKPMKMIAEKIPTVAICGMGKSINNLAKEIIKAEEEYIKMEQMKVLGLNEEILNCKSTLTLEELNKMFSEIDTEIIDTESISNLKKENKVLQKSYGTKTVRTRIECFV